MLCMVCKRLLVFLGLLLRVVHVCMRLLTCCYVYLLCYTAPKFPCKLYKDYKNLSYLILSPHFLMLRWQSGTLSRTKSGHPTPSHPSNHFLKLIFFSSPIDCVGVGVGGRGGGKREREGENLWSIAKCESFFGFVYLFCFI